ncbi:MAG: hypothetical protein ACLFPS_07790 [Clostridia bacterium]
MIYIKKETLSGIREYKFLIILAAYIIFALLDPLMLKFLPILVSGQLGDIDITQAITLNQPTAIMNSISSNYQIISLVIAISLMGLVANELKNKSVVIPSVLGLDLKKWIISKFVVYSAYIIIVSMIAQVVTNIYALTLFDGRTIALIASLKVGMLIGLFHSCILAMVLLFGTLSKRQGIAAFASLAIAFLLPTFSKVLDIVWYTPAGLLAEANYLVSYFTVDGITAVLMSIIFIITILILTVNVVEYKELV